MQKIATILFCFLLISYANDDETIKKFIYSKVDKTDKDTINFISRYLDSDFGLYAYKTNYFIPFAINDSIYPYWNENRYGAKSSFRI